MPGQADPARWWRALVASVRRTGTAASAQAAPTRYVAAPATVRSAQVVWRRVGPSRRPERHLDLHLLVYDPEDTQEPPSVVQFQVPYGSTVSRGQRVQVGIDPVDGTVVFPLPVTKDRTGRTVPDIRFAGKVLAVAVLLIVLLGGGTLAIVFMQRQNNPITGPGIPTATVPSGGPGTGVPSGGTPGPGTTGPAPTPGPTPAATQPGAPPATGVPPSR